jgi:dephospho-CoA kinase
VKRILLTGMSGNGRSTIIGELRARGYLVLDMDEPGWSVSEPDGEWIWHEDRIREALSREDGDVLFISGCAINQGRFYPKFDKIILLSAPAEVLIERLRTRTNNPYGNQPDQLAEVLDNLEIVEPLLRQGADHEINTRAPVDDVVEAILRLVDPPA